jgi:hypothetical protein
MICICRKGAIKYDKTYSKVNFVSHTKQREGILVIEFPPRSLKIYKKMKFKIKIKCKVYYYILLKITVKKVQKESYSGSTRGKRM